MDSRKCQTATATPAKPGELPFGLGALELDVVEDLRMEQVREIARLAPEARRLGLSLGDCVCLAVTKTEGVTAVTTERRWSELRGWRIKVLQIR